MRTSTTLATYAVGLVAVFGAALGVGAAIGSPIDMSTTQHSTHESTAESMPGMDSATPAGSKSLPADTHSPT
ncbi:hypothetical protein N806_08390 [Rhodococcus sp. P27]|nr:hypothetical protein N806_08390 [Rhodococcus sp. P27]